MLYNIRFLESRNILITIQRFRSKLLMLKFTEILFFQTVTQVSSRFLLKGHIPHEFLLAISSFQIARGECASFSWHQDFSRFDKSTAIFHIYSSNVKISLYFN